MKHLQLHRLKKVIGNTIFKIFYPNENKKLEQKHGIGEQYDLVLVSVPVGKQTVAVGYVREFTGWTVKKATEFVKGGDYPKVIMYNIPALFREGILDYFTFIKEEHGIIIEIY
jgi:hypothetical protein